MSFLNSLKIFFNDDDYCQNLNQIYVENTFPSQSKKKKKKSKVIRDFFKINFCNQIFLQKIFDFSKNQFGKFFPRWGFIKILFLLLIF